jgi:hypothetical protein
MVDKEATKGVDVYQLKGTLKNIQPPIWDACKCRLRSTFEIYTTSYRW